MANGIHVVGEQGKGRPFVIVYESGRYTPFAERLFQTLADRCRILLIASELVGSNNWEPLTKELLHVLKEHGIRQASFVAFRDACAIVQNLALTDLRLLRTMVLVDGATRPHPSLRDRLIDRVEALLPLGLPLRIHSECFDAKPYLQRIRCPALVVLSSNANPYHASQACVMTSRLPTCWQVTLGKLGAAQEEVVLLADAVVRFHDVPAKCPQKGSARAEPQVAAGR